MKYIGSYTELGPGSRQMACTWQQAMFYPNTYLNFNANGEYTKHYYNGNERIASRLGENTIDITLNNTNSVQLCNVITEEHFRAHVQALLCEEVPVDMPPAMDIQALQPAGTDNAVYYYHTNHLGSTAFVTDQNQTLTQGFLYAPHGEIGTEYYAGFGSNLLPKRAFNGKELDEETGMYYYEARYYQPPVFTSRDPMFEKYFWMSPYTYCANNPVKFVDPSGREWDLSSLTDEQKATWEKTMTAACGRSKLFKFIYSKLDESSTVYSVKIGKTIDDGNGEQVKGQYNNKDKSITFRDKESIMCFNTYAEEMFHAYQLNENKGNYGTGEFNYEFEAKFAKTLMGMESGYGYFLIEGAESFIKQFEKDYDCGLAFTSKSINETFLSSYKQVANAYAKYNKSNRRGNGNYQTATMVNPYSLILMINSVRP